MALSHTIIIQPVAVFYKLILWWSVGKLVGLCHSFYFLSFSFKKSSWLPTTVLTDDRCRQQVYLGNHYSTFFLLKHMDLLLLLYFQGSVWKLSVIHAPFYRPHRLQFSLMGLSSEEDSWHVYFLPYTFFLWCSFWVSKYDFSFILWWQSISPCCFSLSFDCNLCFSREWCSCSSLY